MGIAKMRMGTPIINVSHLVIIFPPISLFDLVIL